MSRTRRPSPQTTAVLLALAEEPASWRYGYELSRQLDLKAGSLYPILMRLADRGMLETRWESEAPAGRPPRHLYRLTGSGLALATGLRVPAARLSGRSGVPAGIRDGMTSTGRRVQLSPWALAWLAAVGVMLGFDVSVGNPPGELLPGWE